MYILFSFREKFSVFFFLFFVFCLLVKRCRRRTRVLNHILKWIYVYIYIHTIIIIIWKRIKQVCFGYVQIYDSQWKTSKTKKKHTHTFDWVQICHWFAIDIYKTCVRSNNKKETKQKKKKKKMKSHQFQLQLKIDWAKRIEAS